MKCTFVLGKVPGGMKGKKNTCPKCGEPIIVRYVSKVGDCVVEHLSERHPGT